VGKEISDFYKRQVADPLRNELQGGAGSEGILGFLSLDELRQIPDSRVGDLELVEKKTNEVAGKLLTWLDPITSANGDRDRRRSGKAR